MAPIGNDGNGMAGDSTRQPEARFGGRTVLCRNCRFCTTVCPKRVAIPEAMTVINLSAGLETDWFMRKLYRDKCGKGPAGSCIRCGLCLARCPQSLPIPDLMDFAAQRFE